jgi:hypothetical protein
MLDLQRLRLDVVVRRRDASTGGQVGCLPGVHWHGTHRPEGPQATEADLGPLIASPRTPGNGARSRRPGIVHFSLRRH